MIVIEIIRHLGNLHDQGMETTVNAPLAVKEWMVFPPEVVIVPPVHVAVPVG